MQENNRNNLPNAAFSALGYSLGSAMFSGVQIKNVA